MPNRTELRTLYTTVPHLPYQTELRNTKLHPAEPYHAGTSYAQHHNTLPALLDMESAERTVTRRTPLTNAV